jgi:hypothetical protein
MTADEIVEKENPLALITEAAELRVALIRWYRSNGDDTELHDLAQKLSDEEEWVDD